MIKPHPIRSIAKLAIRTAVRSRAFAWLLASTLGITLGLPFALRGDGTAVGHMRVVITYPTAILFAVLLLGTLWLAAGIISLELSSRRLQSVAVKPARAFDIWFGKWLGILAINATLIVVATVSMLLSVNAIAHRYAETPELKTAIQEQILVGRRAIAPEPPPNLMDEAEQQRWALVAEGKIPETVPVDRFFQELKAKRSIVAPGTTVAWNLGLPPSLLRQKPQQKRSLRYHFRCNPTERTPVSGTWTLSAAGCPPAQLAVHNVLDGIHHLAIPNSFQPTATTITAAFTHATTVDAPYLFFDADMPVALLVHESNFTMNLIRGMLAMLCFLATVAASGLMMGTLFSFPVALLAGGAMLFALTLAAGFSEESAGHSHGLEQAPGVITRLAEPVLIALKHATANVVNNIPIAALGDGMLFSWQQTGECLLLLLVLLPAILGAMSAFLLSRKELAA